MFDILCDVWRRPGKVNSPVFPLDLAKLDLTTVDARISFIHKCGIDSLYVYCSTESTDCDGMLEQIFASAERRMMEVIVHENAMMADMSCSDSDIVSCNPMLISHTVKAVLRCSGKLDGTDEVVTSYFVKQSSDRAVEVSEEACDGAVLYDFVQTDVCVENVDILSGEFAETYYLPLFDAFTEKYSKYLKNTFAGFATDRLLSLAEDRLFWSYDMLAEFMSFGGTKEQFASLFFESDKRIKKDGDRTYRKTISARVETAFLKPLAEKCRKNSLVLVGEVPLEFIGTCAGYFTMPIFKEIAFEKHADTEGELLCALKCLSDLSRAGGGCGAAICSKAHDTKTLMREGAFLTVGGGVRVILDEKLLEKENLERLSLKSEDMKKVCLALKRLSTVNTASSTESDCAVLCDDGVIPLSGAEKLMKTGADFSFVSLHQLVNDAEMVDGEIHIDKFTFRSLLVDGRVRLDPSDVMKIGEFAAFGGKMYRSGTFATFAKKNLDFSEFDRECARQLMKTVRIKSGNKFYVFSNTGEESIRIRLPFDESMAGYVFDLSNGGKTPLQKETLGESAFTTLKVLPGSTLTVAYDCNKLPADDTQTYFASQIIALHKGDNKMIASLKDGEKAVLEIDSALGNYCDLLADGNSIARLVCAPYSADVTESLCENVSCLTLSSDGEVKGAVLRILSPDNGQ